MIRKLETLWSLHRQIGVQNRLRTLKETKCSITSRVARYKRFGFLTAANTCDGFHLLDIGIQAKHIRTRPMYTVIGNSPKCGNCNLRCLLYRMLPLVSRKP